MRGHGCRSSTPAAAGAPYVDAAELAGKLMPPLWQYLLWSKARQSHSSSSAHPKASAPRNLGHYPCKTATFEVPNWGPFVPIMDPSSSRPRASPSLRGAVAEVHAPLWQYFSRLLK
jgi:hypothetical protein